MMDEISFEFDKFYKPNLSLVSRCLLFFTIYSLFLGHSVRSCTTIPVSLDDFQYCSGSTCYFSQQVALELPVAMGAEACLELIPPDSVSPIITIDLAVDTAYYFYNVDYIYHTDDPEIREVQLCGCPSGTTATCSTCVKPDQSFDATLCFDGIQESSDCIGDWFGNVGTWCATTGFKSQNRYRVYHMLPNANLNIDINATIGNQTLLFNYQGAPVFYSNSSVPVNVTLLSDTTQPPVVWQYSVVDMYDASDWYMLDSSDVNSLNGYDPRKVGWIKPDVSSKINAGELKTAIQSKYIHGSKCLDDNGVKTTYSMLNTRDFLNANSNKLSKFRAPGSFMTDPDLWINPSTMNKIPDHDITPVEFYDGWMFSVGEAEISDQPALFGFVRPGVYSPPIFPAPQCTASYPIMLSNGTLGANGTVYYCNHIALSGYLPDYNVTKFVTVGMQLMVAPDNRNVFGVCLFGEGFTYTNCYNTSFITYAWPSGILTKFSFFTGFEQQATAFSLPSAFGFYLPPLTGTITILVEFENFTVVFDNTATKPQINSFSYSSTGYFIINMQSITVGGTCYISSDPAGVILAQPLDLPVSPKDFNLTFASSSFNGVLIIDVRCYKYDAQITQNINFNITPTPQPPINNNNQTNGGSGGPLIVDIEGAWDSLKDALIDVWSSGSLTDKIWSVFYWFLIVVGVLVAIIILYFVGMYSWRLFCRLKRHTSNGYNWIRGKGSYKASYKID